MRSLSPVGHLGPAALLALAAPPCSAVLDCFPDRVDAWIPGFEETETGFNADQMPGLVLGPPGSSSPTTGALSVVSLGAGGLVVLEFVDSVLVDGPGADLIVFENPFFVGTVPESPSDLYSVWAEPGAVAVSADGVEFREFPFDADALADVGPNGTPSEHLAGLLGTAGVTPTFDGPFHRPDDPHAWEPEGTGGVAGAGGDAFDLADVGLAEARFVLIRDLGTRVGFSTDTRGLDLDAVVAVHARPARDPMVDADGDRLDDRLEANLYGTDPTIADSDADGTADGVEVATCQDPNGGDGPWFVPSPRLRVEGRPTALDWSTVGDGTLYDVLRGRLSELTTLPEGASLGELTCLEAASVDLDLEEDDADTPAPGEGWFYLVDGGSTGFTSEGRPRLAGDDPCAP